MTGTRKVIGIGVTVALAVASAGAQTGQRRAACPTCDSTEVAAEGAQARTVARLLAELAQYQITVATLKRQLETAQGLGEAERRGIESRLARATTMAGEAERHLTLTCAGGDTPRGYIGATFIVAAEAENRRDTTARRVRYPVVYSVAPGSPAARAGITALDTIIEINRRDARTQELSAAFEPGKTVRITLRRSDGTPPETVVVDVAPRTALRRGACVGATGFQMLVPSMSVSAGGMLGRGAASARAGAVSGSSPGPGRATVRATIDSVMTRAMMVSAPTAIGMFVSSREGGHVAGADLQMLNDGLRIALQLQASDTGAFVVSAPAGGPAGQSGLRSGDVIVRAAGRRVTDIGVMIRAVFDAPARSVELNVLRAEARPGGDARGVRRQPITITLRW